MRPAIAPMLSILLGAGFAFSGMAFAADVAPSAVSFDEYGAVAEPLTAQPGDAAAGRLIVGDKGEGNCVACHAATDLSEVPWHGEIGPMLDGTGDRWTEADLRGILVNAKMMFDGTIMPSFYRTTGYTRPGDEYTGDAAQGELSPLLSAQDIEDVVAYLLTLKES